MPKRCTQTFTLYVHFWDSFMDRNNLPPSQDTAAANDCKTKHPEKTNFSGCCIICFGCRHFFLRLQSDSCEIIIKVFYITLSNGLSVFLIKLRINL